MRKGFTLVEILIGVFVLALALVAIGSVFIVETNRIRTNTDEVRGRFARRSGEVLLNIMDRTDYPLTEGWNVEPLMSTEDRIHVVGVTYSMERSPPISVVMALKSPRDTNPEILVMLYSNYVPVNGDVVVSWYGMVHEVRDGNLALQDFEKEQPIVVIPRQFADVLDHHRMGR